MQQEIQRLKTWIADRVDWIDNNLDAIAPKPVTLTYMVDGEVYKKSPQHRQRKTIFRAHQPKRDIFLPVGTMIKMISVSDSKRETSLQRIPL